LAARGAGAGGRGAAAGIGDVGDVGEGIVAGFGRVRRLRDTKHFAFAFRSIKNNILAFFRLST
jgi:hypothetical protein